MCALYIPFEVRLFKYYSANPNGSVLVFVQTKNLVLNKTTSERFGYGRRQSQVKCELCSELMVCRLRIHLLVKT